MRNKRSFHRPFLPKFLISLGEDSLSPGLRNLKDGSTRAKAIRGWLTVRGATVRREATQESLTEFGLNLLKGSLYST